MKFFTRSPILRKFLFLLVNRMIFYLWYIGNYFIFELSLKSDLLLFEHLENQDEFLFSLFFFPDNEGVRQRTQNIVKSSKSGSARILV